MKGLGTAPAPKRVVGFPDGARRLPPANRLPRTAERRPRRPATSPPRAPARRHLREPRRAAGAGRRSRRRADLPQDRRRGAWRLVLRDERPLRVGARGGGLRRHPHGGRGDGEPGGRLHDGEPPRPPGPARRALPDRRRSGRWAARADPDPRGEPPPVRPRVPARCPGRGRWRFHNHEGCPPRDFDFRLEPADGRSARGTKSCSEGTRPPDRRHCNERREQRRRDGRHPDQDEPGDWIGRGIRLLQWFTRSRSSRSPARCRTSTAWCTSECASCGPSMPRRVARLHGSDRCRTRTTSGEVRSRAKGHAAMDCTGEPSGIVSRIKDLPIGRIRGQIVIADNS